MIEHDEIEISGFPVICPLHDRQPHDKKKPEIKWEQYTCPIIRSAPRGAIGVFIEGYNFMVKCPKCGAFAPDLPPLILSPKEKRKLEKLFKEFNEKP